MKLFSLILELFFIHYGFCSEKESDKSSTPKPDDFSEDLKVLNESIAKYGAPKNYKQLGFPGPKISLDDEKFLYTNKLEYEESDNYILRVRTVTPHFSYTGVYEQVKMPQTFQQFPEIKGQFAEHFARKSGGFYIRTVGYKVDQNGYQQFFLDLTTAQTTEQDISSPSLKFCGGYTSKSGGVTVYNRVDDRFSGDKIWSRPSGKPTISSTVLITLTGGNALG
ncbi:hypothetical protein TcasGA2_TC032999 [Tribolium castaneum]|uniref:Uncharacterized protein n=1 Tax=Tribolium castaneum TaxID=7070 RepID=A0A139WHQ4_TRICA|nr:PREDICTED: uncharacterized protein LOC103314636 [Tribolium castaneum]KYB27528.1 hypothetical protein TcasGA2_TC032999 [Tribolium castaneum]|eukprot:XP_008199336.1 PREDICTED: uncharacterized protein LOC103314636 [Tribolium castaneum]